MKTVAVVAWREIVEHRVFLLAALAALAVTLVVPLFPAFLGWSATDVREVLMWSMALGFTWLSAVFLGASMVTGSVAAGRFGFFLARPASSAAIWFGKLIGVLAVVLTCQLVVVGPAVMASEVKEIDLGLDELVVSGLIVIVPLLLVLLAHAVATVWRGGTAWVVVDLIALAVTIAVGWASAGPLLRVGAEDAAAFTGVLLVVGLAGSVVAAGAAQIKAGRCDGRRQHRAFSAVMWPVLALVSVSVALFSARLMHPSVDDLDSVWVVRAHQSGAWVAVSGTTRGRWEVAASFALNLESGRSLRLAVGPDLSGTSATFSTDGRTAAWATRVGSLSTIRSARLDELSEGVRGSPIYVGGSPLFAMSDDGLRLALIDDGTLSVSELASGDFIGSARLPSGRQPLAPYFFDQDRVRALVLKGAAADEGPSLRAMEFDGAQRTLTETGALAGAESWLWVTIDRARDRLLLRTVINGERTYRYVDARTLEPVAWSADQGFGDPVRMLADGRLVRLVRDGEKQRLERLTPDGEIDARVPLPGNPQHVVIGAEPSASDVVVAVTDRDRWDREPQDWLLQVADLDTGEVREIGRGLPAAAYSWGEVKVPTAEGSPAARLFLGENDSLLLWNPVTGRMEPVVRGRG